MNTYKAYTISRPLHSPRIKKPIYLPRIESRAIDDNTIEGT